MEEKQQTLVSIILPVYNHEAYLATCLESLLAQTYSPIEIIAIDDFSKDASYEILMAFRKKDKRIKVYRNVKHYGLRLTLQRCITRSRGSYIAFMNAKDVSAKSRIQKQLSFLLKHPKIAAVGTQCYMIDGEDKMQGKSNFPEDHKTISKTLLHGLSLHPESIMVSRLRLPKDILSFTTDAYPFIYLNMLLSICKYQEIANLTNKLYYERKNDTASIVSLKKYTIQVVKHWIKGRTVYDTKPSFASLFTPLVKQQ